MRKHWKDLLQNIPSSVRSHGIMIVPLFIFIFIFELFVFNHIDVSADASYYVGKVSTDVYTNTMGHYDPYTGNALSTLDGRRIFACFPEYNAVISQFFHIHPLKQAKVIMPQILSLFTCILYYQIGLLLFKGKKKNTDFTIAVKKPFSDTGEYMELLNINDSSVVSSGTYERYFYSGDGTFYHHILNPKTGYPYESELCDVTIISHESTTGDCLSTTCFVLGADKGMELIESLDGIEAIFMKNDGTKLYSSYASSYVQK